MEENIHVVEVVYTTVSLLLVAAGTMAVAKKLIEQGRIPKDESIVLAITGNGLKTQESLVGKVSDQHVIDAKLEAFEDLYPTLTKGGNEKYAIG